MVWPQVIATVVGGVIGGVGARGIRRSVENQNRGADSIADSKNQGRNWENFAAAAEGNLKRWTQSLNNQRHLEQGGDELEALRMNYQRVRDASTRADFAGQLQGDEQAGGMVAAAATAGVRGSVVDTLNMTTRLRQSMAEESAKTATDQMTFDSVKAEQNIYSQMIGGLDNSVLLDRLDYRKDVSMHKAVPSVFMGVVEGAMKGAQFNFSGAADKTEGGPKTGTFGNQSPTSTDSLTRPQEYQQSQQFRFNYGNGNVTEKVKDEGNWWSSTKETASSWSSWFQ